MNAGPLPPDTPTNASNLQARLAAMQDTMRRIEQEVMAGSIPPDGMEDFKRAVDDARMRIWAVLTAANTEDPQAFMQRFRLRRAIEICRSVVRDVSDGTLREESDELLELKRVSRQLAGLASAK
jgi:hypothetical protein